MAEQRRDVVVVERGGDSSVKWLVWGALLGAGVALLYAPRSGEETRRALQKRVRRLRAAAEEKLDEVVGQLKSGARRGLDAGLAALDDDDQDDWDDEDGMDGAEADLPLSARAEVEARLASARARRRTGGEPA